MSLREALSVLIGANADPLIQELKKSEKEVKAWGESVQSSLEKARIAGEAAATLLGVSLGAGFAEMLHQTLESTAALDDQARQLGLNVEKFQGLSFAARQNGIDQETFATGLNKLSSLLGDAAAGSQTAADTFTRWGISIRDASGNIVGVDDLLSRVADRFATISDPALRSRAAVELFSRGGFQMIDMLTRGSEGLAAFQQQAQAMGAILSGETVKQAKELSDQLAAIGTVVKVNLTEAIVTFLPSAEKLSDWFNVAKITAKEFAFVIKEIANGDFLKLNFNGFAELQKYDAQLRTAAEDAKKIVIPPVKAPDVSGHGFQPVNTTKIHAEVKGQQELSDYIAKLGEENSELSENNTQKEIAQNLFQAEAIARRNNIELTDEERGKIADLSIAIVQQRDAAEAARQKMEESRQFANQLSATMTSSFESAITGGKGLRDVFSGLTQDIEKMILRFAILQPLAQYFFGGTKGGGLLSGAIGDVTSGLFGRAGGGPVVSGSPYMVGENGPELFIPNISGNIASNRSITASDGGGSARVSPNFNFAVTVNGPAASDPRAASDAGTAFALSAKTQILSILQEQQRPGGMLYGRAGA